MVLYRFDIFAKFKWIIMIYMLSLQSDKVNKSFTKFKYLSNLLQICYTINEE